MKRSAQLFIWLITLLTSITSFAQEKPIYSLTEDDGLANNVVHDLTKDNQGYLWIATGNGLSKYDGKTFVNFRVRQGLPGNIIRAVTHDENNRIYVACYKAGLAILENNKVFKVLHVTAYENDKIRKLYYSKTHHLLIVGTDYGIYALKDSTFYLLSNPNGSEGQSSILSIIECNGIIYYTLYTDITHKEKGFYKIEVNREDVSKSLVTRIIGGDNGFGCTSIDSFIFVNLGLTIYKYLPKSGDLSKIAPLDSLFLCWAMSPSRPNKLILGGRSEENYLTGIKVLDLLTKNISDLNCKLKSPVVNNIIEDQDEKCTWICCDLGLFCLKDSPFEIYNIADKSGILDITVKKDSLFILTEDNIWRLDKGKQKLLFDKEKAGRIIEAKSLLFDSNRSNEKAWKVSNRFSIYDKNVKFLHFNSNGDQTYLLTYRGAVSFPDWKSYLPIRGGSFISYDNQKTFWIPPYHNLYCLLTTKTTTQVFQYDFHQDKPIKDIKRILKKGDIIYFASTLNGLYALQGEKIFYLNSSNSKLENTLSDMDIDFNGNIWCTSTTGNLYKIEFKDKLNLALIINQDNSEIIGDNYKWLKFNANYLYIGTNKGLNKIPISELIKSRIDSVQFFNKANGYENISAESPISDSQGNIYVFTPERVIKILNANTFMPARNISFTDIKVDNNLLTLAKINEKAISHNTKSISIEFSLFKFPSTKNIEYRYKVNDGEWGKGNQISLQSLKSGKYEIICQAKDHESANSYQEILFFQINKPFWLSWWFFVLGALSIISATYWVLHSHFRKKSRQNDEKARLSREIAELRMQSLQSQMNPHFVFNSLNSIQNFILSNDIEKAVTYLGTLGSLIRINLEHVSKEYISLSEEVKFLEKYIEIEKMRFKEELTINITMNANSSNQLILPPMLIQPLIENSIKYRNRSSNYKGRIQVEFGLENNLMKVTVTDNGIGRSNSKINLSNPHKSLGLDLISKRLSLLNEKFETNEFHLSITDLHHNGTPSGTKVQVSIPQFYTENKH